jgi:hypothetical protein
MAAENRYEAGDEHSSSIESESYIARWRIVRLCCDFHRGDELCHSHRLTQQVPEEMNFGENSSNARKIF